MDEIRLTSWYGKYPFFLQGFKNIPGGLFGISSINSITIEKPENAPSNLDNFHRKTLAPTHPLKMLSMAPSCLEPGLGENHRFVTNEKLLNVFFEIKSRSPKQLQLCGALSEFETHS